MAFSLGSELGRLLGLVTAISGTSGNIASLSACLFEPSASIEDPRRELPVLGGEAPYYGCGRVRFPGPPLPALWIQAHVANEVPGVEMGACGKFPEARVQREEVHEDVRPICVIGHHSIPSSKGSLRASRANR